MMNRVEDNQLHFLHVWISVFCQILLIYKNIDDFSNEIIAGFAFVILLLDAALYGHREIGEHRSVDHCRLLDAPSRLLHLLWIVLGRNNAYEIRIHHGFLGSEGNGKLATKLQVVCGDVISHRNHNLLHVLLSCPGSAHCVGNSFLFILVCCLRNRHTSIFSPVTFSKKFHRNDWKF